MLDTIFRNAGDRKQSQDDLRSLVDQARDERAAITALLEQVNGAATKLGRTNQALETLGDKAEAMSQRFDRLAGVATTFEKRAKSFDKLEARMNEMLADVAEAKRVSEALATSGSDPQPHLKAAEALKVQGEAALATLDTLRKENEKLVELRAQLGVAKAEVGLTVESVATLKDEFQSLREQGAELSHDVQGLRDSSRDTRTHAEAAVNAAREIEGKLGAMNELQALTQGTEKRLSALNALAEHVSHKAKALETQKQTIEHAVVEATRLNEMVWTMDAQLAKLASGHEQLAQAEEAVARMEALAHTTAQELSAATASREAHQQESVRLEAQGRNLVGELKLAVDRLTVDKQEVDAFDQRLKSLGGAVSEAEARMLGVLAKDEALAQMQRQSEGLAVSFTALNSQANDLVQKQGSLDTLAEQLAQVDGLARRTATQHDSLLQARQDLEAVRLELSAFHQAHAQAAQLRDKLAVDRAALETFSERTASFLSRTPDLEARLDAVLGKMERVDEGSQAAARLAEVASELDAQLTRVSARMQFVEKLDERVNGLHKVTTEVDHKLVEQLERKAELDGLRNTCDTLSTQVVDAQQKLEGVAALQGRLLPLAAQVTALTQTLDASQRLVDEVKLDKDQVLEQQARFAELVEQGKALSSETTERLKQVRSANDDLDRATALKESLLVELAQVQAKQREAMAQTELAQEQLQRTELVVKQLEQRRAQWLQSEQSMAGYAGRLEALDRNAEAVEHKIQSLAEREALVQAVKLEVDNIRQISLESKADLQHVSGQRAEVSEMRGKLDELLGRVKDTDSQIALIESRRKTVEEVQSRAAAITHMLGDINVNLEMLSEQRAVIDHVGEKLARLDFTVQEAQNTLRSLQREREVAERIEQGIKALRARSSGGLDKLA
jgi:chromosome segregation ATPase